MQEYFPFQFKGRHGSSVISQDFLVVFPDHMKDDRIVSRIAAMRMLLPLAGKLMNFHMAMKCDPVEDDDGIPKVRSFAEIMKTNLHDLQVFILAGAKVFLVEVLILPDEL